LSVVIVSGWMPWRLSSFQQLERGVLVAPLLDQNIENLTLVVDGAP
jgi:hypothetical protein